MITELREVLAFKGETREEEDEKGRGKPGKGNNRMEREESIKVQYCRAL